MSSSEEPDSAAKQSEMHGLLGQLMRRYRDLTRHWEAFRLSGDGSGSSTFGNDETASFQFCRDLAENREPQHGNNEEAWPPELLRLLQLGSQTIAGISKASTADAGRTYRTEFTIDVVRQYKRGLGHRESKWYRRHLERPKVRFRREPPPANAASPILSDSEEEHNLEGGRPLSEVIEDYKREETEAKSRLVISCVVDTKDKAVLSLDEAVQRGIVSWDTGSYLNRETGDWMPIQAALSRGLIIAESRTEGRAKVKNRRVYGLVTLQSTDSKSADKLAKAAGDGGSYLIYSALDVANGTALSFQAAKEAGVIDAEEGVFWNSRTGEALELPVAIKKGFVRARKVMVFLFNCRFSGESNSPSRSAFAFPQKVVGVTRVPQPGVDLDGAVGPVPASVGLGAPRALVAAQPEQVVGSGGDPHQVAQLRHVRHVCHDARRRSPQDTASPRESRLPLHEQATSPGAAAVPHRLAALVLKFPFDSKTALDSLILLLGFSKAV
uniref:Reverse transcriptase Ty1/copia-type domain-containing protein n=1 Tax=Macrostomum lignano TaxID=282301 RepID=A0A1I8FT17_9PLAT